MQQQESSISQFNGYQKYANSCKIMCKSFIELYPTVFGLYFHPNDKDHCPHFVGFYTDISQIPEHYMNIGGNPSIGDDGVEWKAFITVVKTNTLSLLDLTTKLHHEFP